MSTELIPNDTSNQLAASFIPALLRRQFANDPARKAGSKLSGDHSALLWIDICAFSPLSNRLIQDHIRGVERLSKILRNHYEKLLDAITEYSGEPIVFAGDGLLAAWPCDFDSIKQAIQNASACAHAVLALEKATDDRGDALLLHIVVAGGTCRLLELGGVDGRWMFTYVGEALSDLSMAAKNRAPGQILLSKNALKFLGPTVHAALVDYEAAILKNIIKPATLIKSSGIELSLENIETLHAYVPKPIIFRLDSERLQWIDELRPVTVVFMQLPEFASDAADAVQRLQRSAEIAMPVILKHDGLLIQVWVDEKAANFLICFGPPPASHDNNPVRGVRTALDLRATFSEAGFKNCIGVATGGAFCGILGNDMLRQYTVIGDVVNLGARFAELKNDSVYCDATTKKGCRDEFDFKDLQMVTIRGKDEPVAIWELQRSVSFKTSLRARLPMIGRHAELSYLLEYLKQSVAGGQVSLVVEGDSGIGKTRLMADFKTRAVASGQRILMGVGDRIERGIPYRSWRGIFSSLLGLDTVSGLKAQQTVALRYLRPEKEGQACLLNVVLPLNLPDSDTIMSLSGQQRVSASHNLLLQLIMEAASAQPLVIIIDDAQWMDEASWRLAADITGTIPNCFLICSVQSMEGLSDIRLLLNAGASTLLLKGLPDEFQDKLICAFLGIKQVPEQIASLVWRLAKGNPFFCLELTQALLDEGAIVVKDGICHIATVVDTEHLPLPETIQGAVRRRIDSLSPGPELALKVASVAGLRFATELIKNVYPIKHEAEGVTEHLDEDSRFGLILRETVDGFEGYSFNNSITRDVTYGMMLFEQRQRLHRKIAEWYEQALHENLSPFFARLAYHWQEAGESEKAAGYFEKEAIRLFSAGYAKQSVDLGLRGVALLKVIIERDPAEIGKKISENMGSIAILMAGRSPADLIHLNEVDDNSIERVLWMLLRIAPFAFQSQQIELYALITITCLRITLEHGNGAAAADVYSLYSVIHGALTGDRKAANAWSQLAIDLDRQNGGAAYSRVAFVHTWFHNHWVNHLSDSFSIALSGAKSGFDSGEILFACFNLTSYVVYLAAAGRPINEVINSARAHLAQNNRRVANAVFTLITELQIAKAFAGLTEHPLVLTDEEYDEERDIAYICETEFGNQIGTYMVGKIKLHTHFGDWAGALDLVKRMTPVLPAITGQTAEVELVQYHALAAMCGAIESSADLTGLLLEEAQSKINTMRNWADMCSPNFLHKALLLEAFYEGVCGNPDAAQMLFEQAAKSASANGYLNDLALVHEYHTMIQQRNGNVLTAFEPALNAYQQWGAIGKVTYLKNKYIIR